MPNPVPSILILIADQLTPGALPAYRNAVVQAPNIERPATEGVVFESACCASPLCAPSRLDALDDTSKLRSEIPTVTLHLRNGD